MKKLEKIKEQILTIIQKEESKTRSELEELSRKQQDNMDFYGIGGPYQRYEHAIERRRNHLSELEALRKTQASVIQRFWGSLPGIWNFLLRLTRLKL